MVINNRLKKRKKEKKTAREKQTKVVEETL